jgi:hypothetical protein
MAVRRKSSDGTVPESLFWYTSNSTKLTKYLTCVGMVPEIAFCFRSRLLNKPNVRQGDVGIVLRKTNVTKGFCERAAGSPGQLVDIDGKIGELRQTAKPRAQRSVQTKAVEIDASDTSIDAFKNHGRTLARQVESRTR